MQKQHTTIAAAREWLKELDGEGSFGYEDQGEYEEAIDAASDAKVLRLIARHFAGGWNAFAATFEVAA